MKESYEFMRMPMGMRQSFTDDATGKDAYNVSYDYKPINPFPDKTPVAMAYVPYQQWCDVYTPEEGLSRGTIFPELDLPFSGGDCIYE